MRSWISLIALLVTGSLAILAQTEAPIDGAIILSD